MDYGGHDHMTLGGLVQPNSTELSKMVENATMQSLSGLLSFSGKFALN